MANHPPDPPADPCAAVLTTARARLAAGESLTDLLAAHPACAAVLADLVAAALPAPPLDTDEARVAAQLQAGWNAAFAQRYGPPPAATATDPQQKSPAENPAGEGITDPD